MKLLFPSSKYYYKSQDSSQTKCQWFWSSYWRKMKKYGTFLPKLNYRYWEDFVPRLQPEDLQQPGVRHVALPERQPGVWGSLHPRQDVFNQVLPLVHSGTAPCSIRYCTLFNQVLHLVQSGTAPCSIWYSTLFNQVLHLVQSGTAPGSITYCTLFNQVLHLV